jgi:hypothetical protein
MSQDQNNNITIDFVSPDNGEGEDLEGCYFIYDRSNDTYSFFEEDSDTPLATGLRKGHHFDFTLNSHPKRDWKLHISKKSTPVMVEGSWKSKHKQEQDDLSSGDWEPEGSYQATAGGGVEGEINAATAGA